MGTVVVVTNHGWGEIWKFESLLEAQVHPQVRDGDAVMSGTEDLVRDYNDLEWPKLMMKLRLEGAVAIGTALRSLPPMRQAEIIRDNARRVWHALLDQATIPPLDPNKETNMAKAEAAAKAAEKPTPAAKKETVAKEPKAPKGPQAPKGYTLADTIHFAKNAEGKEYHPTENNPKRPSSVSHARFAQYKNGMTIGDALAAGVLSADISWDVSHKFIIIKSAPKVAEVKTAAAA
jgi:hypothetical protein